MPDPICMECGGLCTIWEIVATTWYGVYELWCYCPKCDVQTFHPLPEQMRIKGY